MIVKRLIRAALKAGAIIDINDDIPPVEYEDALESCNSMLKLWASRGLITYHVVTESHAMTAGINTYTIGITGNINSARPSSVVGGYILDNNGVSSPIEIISRDDYNGISVKSITGRPCKVYVVPSFPISTLVFEPVPDIAYTVYLDSLKPLAELVLDSDLNLPTEYEEAIKWNLAVRLAPDYNKPLRRDVAELAYQAYSALSIQPVPKADFTGVFRTRNSHQADPNFIQWG